MEIPLPGKGGWEGLPRKEASTWCFPGSREEGLEVRICLFLEEKRDAIRRLESQRH